MSRHQRTALLIGEPAAERLAQARVLVLGVGGVGGAAAEMLCRAGIRHLTLVDGDVIEESNCNRQLFATAETIGMPKTQAASMRLLAIDPDAELHCIQRFLTVEDIPALLADPPDYAVDAIDCVPVKVAFLAECYRRQIPVISAMGTGAKMDPESLRRADISKTEQCALARVVRRQLREQGITRGISVIYSTEPAAGARVESTDAAGNRRNTTGTISYLPNLAGCHCAAAVIRDLIG
ncbi:MAG: tRNA threonylcarbamoyladenosine dehydratase [Lentisphaeria bacterium]|nr:tRNA threonylcarbamoyladenosine dehydratase [Lentisphaeria bacterium]